MISANNPSPMRHELSSPSETLIPQEVACVKNPLAAIGLIAVLKKGYELYHEYSELKRDKRAQQPSAT
ncbi:hypothetical protein IPC561_09920 [Pseudomonas aeruginosa]|nr:hypothetical protein IPC1434_03080 [Pseudomonas aeruginosa]RUG80538.1 hypothetical protein IPC561_09920 [Pseudomonas aeruginosa]RUG92099.1 hypothetical protein IPC562_12485 [Pseudomonas aeruginosa]